MIRGKTGKLPGISEKRRKIREFSFNCIFIIFEKKRLLSPFFSFFFLEKSKKNLSFFNPFPSDAVRKQKKIF